MRRLLAVTVCVGLVTACTPSPSAVGGVTATNQDRSLFDSAEVLLKGRVMLPTFALKATNSDLADSATVILSDGNGPLATGLADPSGNFTLYQPSSPAAPFSPTDGYFYKLEVLKRVPVAGSGLLLSMQTVIKRTGDTWTSITGSTIVVNLLTTVVTLVQKEDETTDFDRIMGVVTGEAFDTVATFGGHPVLALRSRLALLRQMLADNLDPGGGDQDYPLPVYTGDVAVSDAASLAVAQGYAKIVGNLTISGSDAPAVALPDLVWVTGSITADDGSSDRTAVAMPKLRRVDGSLTIKDAPNLTTVDLPQLNVVGQNLELSGLDALASVPFNGLEIVGGVLRIRDNAVLPDCQVTALRDRITEGSSDVANNLGACP